jgi:hypothetical protein
MSALGHKRTSVRVRLMSALPPKADIDERERQKRTFVDWSQHCRSTGASGTGAVSTGRTILNKAPFLPSEDAVR